MNSRELFLLISRAWLLALLGLTGITKEAQAQPGAVHFEQLSQISILHDHLDPHNPNSPNHNPIPCDYQEWWFWGIIALMLVGSAIAGYRLRGRNIEKRSRELEALVEERTRALEDRTRELEERTREIERRRQEVEALYQADVELHRYLGLDKVLQALVDTAVDILQADKGSLMVWDKEDERLVMRVARGFAPDTIPQISFAPGEGVAGRVAVTGEPIIVEDTHRDPRTTRHIIEPEGIHSFMQVPIKIGGEVFGVFSADYVRHHTFDDDEQRLLVALAQRAALAIENAQLYEQAQELAIVQERNRLARELHDAVTQTLFSASLIAEALPALWEVNREEGEELLQELKQLNRGALAEMRTLLLELRPAALIETDLGDLLHQLAAAVTGRSGLPVTVTLEGGWVLPSDVHVTLYRIAQEALNNVVKHAQPSGVTVSLQRSARGDGLEAELCVCDDGRGFEPERVPPDRMGLGIIRERAQAIGARFDIESRPGQGTRVVIKWAGKKPTLDKNPKI